MQIDSVRDGLRSNTVINIHNDHVNEQEEDDTISNDSDKTSVI